MGLDAKTAQRVAQRNLEIAWIAENQIGDLEAVREAFDSKLPEHRVHQLVRAAVKNAEPAHRAAYFRKCIVNAVEAKRAKARAAVRKSKAKRPKREPWRKSRPAPPPAPPAKPPETEAEREARHAAQRQRDAEAAARAEAEKRAEEIRHTEAMLDLAERTVRNLENGTALKMPDEDANRALFLAAGKDYDAWKLAKARREAESLREHLRKLRGNGVTGA
jgi:hypothetical protein